MHLLYGVFQKETASDALSDQPSLHIRKTDHHRINITAADQARQCFKNEISRHFPYSLAVRPNDISAMETKREQAELSGMTNARRFATI